MKVNNDQIGLPRLALIGCGYWGKNHARNLSALGVLDLVCDPSEAGRDLAQTLAPNAKICSTPEEVFQCKDIDAVVIATPAETHCDLALKAFSNGMHVAVEKPMALTYADALKMQTAAQAHDLTLLVGHLLEYHPAIIAIKTLITDGSLGKLQYVYSNRLNFGKIRVEENALWSFAPHDIALILRIIGAAPIEVTCSGGDYVTPGLADINMSNFRFENGVRAHIFTSWLNPFKEQKLVIIGDKKMAVFDDTEPVNKLAVYDQYVSFNGSIPTLNKKEREIIKLPTAEPLRTQSQAFLNAIQTGQSPLTDGFSGSNVIRVLEACQKSLNHHGQPVQLSDIN